jgi:transcriptional regulator with XRE-family HTH domain
MDRPFRAQGDRIRRLRRAKDLTQQDVADALKVSIQSVSQWETGRTQPEADRLYDLAELIGGDVGHLKTGAAPLLRDETYDSEDGIVRRYADFMPTKEMAAEMLPRLPIDVSTLEGSIIAQFNAAGKLFAYQVDDDEMDPLIKIGDLLVLDTGLPVRVGDVVLAFEVNTNKASLREVRGIRLDDGDNQIVDLRPANPQYPQEAVRLGDENSRILGTVVEHRRVRRRW